MRTSIEAILFDVGGTLRNSTHRDQEEMLAFISQIEELIHSGLDPKALQSLLVERASAYRKWSLESLVELSEEELWLRWLLPDQPAETIRPLATRLNHLWRESQASREVFPETRQVILTLYRRGYRLGLVSNTTSSVEIPALLDELKISGCFETIIMSCEVGKRKPGAAILLEAAERMGVQPGHCAYVGDRPDRDVAAARGAGFSMAIIRNQPERLERYLSDPALAPDHIIQNLNEILAYFPERFTGMNTGIQPVYDASISSMWGMKKFADLEDFFRAAPRLGFSRIELNHMVNPAMLESIDLSCYSFSSIHEPCPARIPEDHLKKQDLLISSPVEERRNAGVESIRWSIDLARQLGVGEIIVHTGQVQHDPSLEKRLIALFEQGKKDTPEYNDLKAQMVAARSEKIGPCLEAVIKSLRELLEYARPYGIRLGLENRYHYFDIPSQEEMALLLDIAGPEELGFIFDCGHAQSMDCLGFFPGEAWLERFGKRIIGTHLHDAIGVHDHYAPGRGEIDFRLIARYLPKEAFRTIEVQSHNSCEQIKNGLKILADAGCIRTL